MRRDAEPAYAMAYAHLLPTIQKTGREHGYTIALHGSMRTDMDVLAVPWIEDASDAETLIAAIMEAIGGHYAERDWDTNPSSRPHGRLAWAIYFDEESGRLCKGPYLDISVMPKAHHTTEPG